MSSASEDMLSSQCWLHQAPSLVHSVDAQNRHGTGGVQPRAGRAVAFRAQAVLPAGRYELAGWQVVFHVNSPLGVAAFRRLRHCFVGWCPLLRWSCWRHPAGLCPLRPSSQKLCRSFGARGLAMCVCVSPRCPDSGGAHKRRAPEQPEAGQLMFLSLLPFLLPGIAALRDGRGPAGKRITGVSTAWLLLVALVTRRSRLTLPGGAGL